MERARELDPFSIIINTELGCPYLYSKRYARAIEYFRKAVEMDPNFPFAHFALAEAYDRVGRYREAWDEHEKALELAQRGQAVDLSGGDAPRAWYALTGPLQNARREIGGASYWADAAFIAAAGIPTVMFGPGGEGAHAIEEWVSLADTERVARTLTGVAERICR